MDLWIRSDSERTVGGVIAVVAILLPWDVTYIADIAGGSLLYVRFPLFEFQYAMGIQTAPTVVVRLATAAADLHATGPLAPAYQAALAGAAIAIIAAILGLSLLVTDAGTGATRIVRLLGVLVAASGVAFFVAWVMVLTRGAPGIDLPLGAIVTPILGAVLVVAERR
ncbi:MAG: hypothetical protein ABEJ57_02290 [Halobacteriaceae archaeon]